MMFSGHDTNVANIWSYLQPIEFKQDNLIGQYVDWYQVPYATSIQIELHKMKGCKPRHKGASNCFYMQFLSNGQPLVFRDLKSIHNERGMTYTQTRDFELKAPGVYDESEKDPAVFYNRISPT